jgi:hypothetical protein
MKREREHKIVEEILADNVADRSAESLGIGIPVPAMSGGWSGSSGTRMH